MACNQKITLREYLAINILRNLRFKLLITMGRGVRFFLDIFDSYKKLILDNGKDSLTEHEVNYLNETVDAYLAKFVSPLPIEIALQSKAILLCEKLIKDASTNSVLNIGSRYDMLSSTLAPRFPSTDFLSVDFGKAYEESLRRLFTVPKNWRIQGGYPLALLQDGSAKGDLVVFCGVTVWLTNAEYRSYLKCLSSFASSLVIVDIWSSAARHLNLFKVLRPESIDPDISAIMESSAGGRYAHNHVALLQWAGYEVNDYEIEGSGLSTYIISLTATKK